MNWNVTTKAHYFHVDGEEWPTLLVEMADWLVETNNAVDTVTFFQQFEKSAGLEPYISGTIYYTDRLSASYDPPIGYVEGGLLEDLKDLVDVYAKE